MGVGDVVGALAVGGADRVDRRQVQDVEPEIGDVGQPCDHVAQGPVLAGLGGGRAREQLVPGREPGVDRIHRHLERRLGQRLPAAVRVAAHQVRERHGARGAGPLLDPGAAHELVRQCSQPARIGARRPFGRLRDQDGPHLELRRHVLSGVQALVEVPAPGREQVCPCSDLVGVAAHRLERHLCLPSIVVRGAHRQLLPRAGRPVRAGSPVPEDHAHDIVTVHERVGLHHEDIADLPLHGEAAAVDLGRDVLDDGATPTIDAGAARVQGRAGQVRSSKGPTRNPGGGGSLRGSAHPRP